MQIQTHKLKGFHPDFGLFAKNFLSFVFDGEMSFSESMGKLPQFIYPGLSCCHGHIWAVTSKSNWKGNLILSCACIILFCQESVSKCWWSAEPVVTSLHPDSSLTRVAAVGEALFLQKEAPLVSLLMWLVVQSESLYLPLSNIFRAANSVFCVPWKTQNHHSLWNTRGWSQEYLGNLSPSLPLIILLFTSMLNWDSPGSTFPKQRTKGFPWEWGLALSVQWTVNKLYSTVAGFLFIVLLEKFRRMTRPLELGWLLILRLPCSGCIRRARSSPSFCWGCFRIFKNYKCAWLSFFFWVSTCLGKHSEW